MSARDDYTGIAAHEVTETRFSEECAKALDEIDRLRRLVEFMTKALKEKEVKDE